MKIKYLFIFIAALTLTFFNGCAATDELSYHLSESYTDEPFGTYVAELPSASGMGRLIVLHLFENGNAIRTNVYVGEPQGDYIEEGTWTVEHGEVKVLLANADASAKETYLSFKYDIEGLRSTTSDETPMGKTQVFFTRIEKSF